MFRLENGLLSPVVGKGKLPFLLALATPLLAEAKPENAYCTSVLSWKTSYDNNNTESA